MSMFRRKMMVGEGFVGDRANAAHVNVVFGHRATAVGVAWSTALATPREGHVPFVTVARPGIPVVPFTLFVNKAAIANERHGNLTWGAAQAGIAAGVGLAHAEKVFGSRVSQQLLIAAVWVNPLADDEEAVFANNREATLLALRMARADGPDISAALAAMADPANPYFRQSSY